MRKKIAVRRHQSKCSVFVHHCMMLITLIFKNWKIFFKLSGSKNEMKKNRIMSLANCNLYFYYFHRPMSALLISSFTWFLFYQTFGKYAELSSVAPFFICFEFSFLVQFKIYFFLIQFQAFERPAGQFSFEGWLGSSRIVYTHRFVCKYICVLLLYIRTSSEWIANFKHFMYHSHVLWIVWFHGRHDVFLSFLFVCLCLRVCSTFFFPRLLKIVDFKEVLT